MHQFIRNTLSLPKLHQLCVNTALGDFVGFVAGSLVMKLTTYQTVEHRALKNLFGILPRHTVVVHRLPEWLEFTLLVLVGYLVMELVRYVISSNKYLRLIGGTASGISVQHFEYYGAAHAGAPLVLLATLRRFCPMPQSFLP